MDRIRISILFLLCIFLCMQTSPGESIWSKNTILSYETLQEEDLINILSIMAPMLFIFGILIIVVFVVYLIFKNIKTTKKDLELSQKSIELHEETNKLLKQIAEALLKKK